MKILVVELWNIGDVVLTLPFLSQLRAKFPKARVTFLGQPYAAELLEGSELVHEFIETRLTWNLQEKGWGDVPANTPGFLRTIRELRRRKFDIAFQSRSHVREYVLLGLSGARRRVGFAKGGWDRLLTDRVVSPVASTPRSNEWLRLLEPFGGAQELDVPRLRVSDDERTFANTFIKSWGIDPQRLVGIHPGASVPEKRWPLDRFRAVAEKLTSAHGIDVLAFVEPSGYGASLGEIEGVMLARVGLREMMALLEKCRLLVCNDSGPMHIAGALRVQTAAVFGTGISERFAPLGDLHESIVAEQAEDSAVPRKEAHPYASVARVSTETVLASVLRLLAAQTAGSADPRQASILLDHARR